VIATMPSPWWLFENATNTFPPLPSRAPTKKVGSPCESRSLDSGSARQILRTRASTRSAWRAVI